MGTPFRSSEDLKYIYFQNKFPATLLSQVCGSRCAKAGERIWIVPFHLSYKDLWGIVDVSICISKSQSLWFLKGGSYFHMFAVYFNIKEDYRSQCAWIKEYTGSIVTQQVTGSQGRHLGDKKIKTCRCLSAIIFLSLGDGKTFQKEEKIWVAKE